MSGTGIAVLPADQTIRYDLPQAWRFVALFPVKCQIVDSTIPEYQQDSFVSHRIHDLKSMVELRTAQATIRVSCNLEDFQRKIGAAPDI